MTNSAVESYDLVLVGSSFASSFFLLEYLKLAGEDVRILVLERGRIVERGSHPDLLAAGGLYRRLYDLQFQDADPGARS